MIESIIDIPRRRLFASIAGTEEESRKLDLLIRETRYFASIAKKTGLHVAHECKIDGRTAVAFALNSPADLGQEDRFFVEKSMYQAKEGCATEREPPL